MRVLEIYGKLVRATGSFDLMLPENRLKICEWLERRVAPHHPYLLPGNGVQKRHAVHNLRGLEVEELLYMVACLQESNQVPAYSENVSVHDPPPFRPPAPADMRRPNTVPDFVALVPSRRKGAGLGIVNASHHTIPAGTVVGYYAGQDVDIDEGRRRAREDDNPYILLVVDAKGGPRSQDEYAVDAKDRILSTWTRFINEPRGNEKENTQFVWLPNQPIHVITTRPVSPGDEFLLFYG
jgi:hypothetical protein